MSLKGVVGAATLVAALAGAPGAGAAELLTAKLSSASSTVRACSDRPATGEAGNVKRSLTAPSLGWVNARLDGSGGDWDLAVFEADTGRLVAGSSGFGSDEVASGVAQAGEKLTVQACRLSGTGSRATLDVGFTSIDTSKEPAKLSLVRVAVANQDRKRELSKLGLDLTEHGGEGFVEVVLHGPGDARRLREHKFVYTTEIGDLSARTIADRKRDAAYAGRVRASAFPSNRTTYRRLPDYGEDMKKLVRENPTLVRPITLPFKTWTGRSVEGVEIASNVANEDGRPVFLNMGAHHGREWPSAEHAMEWAVELVNGYRSNNARVRSITDRVRTIVVPVVNPDGFNTSREAGEGAGAGGGRGGPNETANLVIPYEYQRKNCRVNNTSGDDPEQGNCQQQPATGIQQFGVDPNRNYGGFWGGDGATPNGGNPPGDYAADYRGNGPFSEPETRNVRDLVSKRHVVTLITNHTFSNLLLRPPGIQRQGPPVDEPVYKQLGREMAMENGYKNVPSYRLYDTTGGTEDWTYYSTGGLGFTFEIGPNNFHPPFQETVDEYDGNTAPANATRDGQGNREAYFKAAESTGNTSRHAVLAGAAPSGAILRLRKSFKTSTSPVKDRSGNEGPPILFDDTLDTTMQTKGARFEWHINPSTRPVVAQTRGRPATGSPSPTISQPNNPPPVPPCPAYFELGSEACPPTSYRDEAFTIPPNGGGVDNAFATIKIDWISSDNDYDLEIFRDANGDGDLNDVNEDNEPESDPIASSAQGGTDFEETTIGPDPAPGRYIARTINFAGAEPYDLTISFAGPEPFKPGGSETWQLTCESFSGSVLTSQAVFINRGEQKDPGLQACAAAFDRAFTSGRGCDVATGRASRTSFDRARLGRNRLTHLRRFKIGVRGRGSIDKFCFTDRRQLRIGYPSSRLRRGFGRSRTGRSFSRRFTSGKAVLILTSSKRFRVGKVRVGSSTRTLRRSVGRRARGIRVGRNVWYTKRGSKARLVYKVRGKRVYEVGIADKSLTGTRSRQAKFFKSFR